MNEKPQLRVGIACNLKTDSSSEAQAEFDEPETIAAISGALRSGGFDPVVLEASERFLQRLEAEKPDIVFNIAEGKSGRAREAQIPAILEYSGVPYTGSDAVALAISLDKALTKRVVRSFGIETPAFAVIEKGTMELPEDILYPVIVKPNAEGSGIGISDGCVAANPAQLRELAGKEMERHVRDLLIEQYIDGREFTVGILGNKPDLHVFEPMEVIFKKLRGPYKVYSYEVKKNFRDYIVYRCPPELPDCLMTRMKRDAEVIFESIGCRDFARIDFRLSGDGTVHFIEINPLPGLAPGYSDFPMLAEFSGIAYNDLICKMLNCALKRYGSYCSRPAGEGV